MFHSTKCCEFLIQLYKLTTKNDGTLNKLICVTALSNFRATTLRVKSSLQIIPCNTSLNAAGEQNKAYIVCFFNRCKDLEPCKIPTFVMMTSCVWPRRWLRSKHCSSMAGFQAYNIKVQHIIRLSSHSLCEGCIGQPSSLSERSMPLGGKLSK